MEKWPPLAKPWDASQLLQPSVGKVYPKHLDLNPARNQKKKHVSRKEVVAGKKKNHVVVFCWEWWYENIWSFSRRSISWNYLLHHRQLFFCWPSKGKLSRPRISESFRCFAWRSSKMRKSKRRKFQSHWLRTCWWKTRGNFDRWHLFIYLISIIYIYIWYI